METIEEKAKTFGGDRRSFLKNAGVGAVAAALIMSCKKKSDDPAPVTETPVATDPGNMGTYLGKGDVGVLNFAYALEQLEVAFYDKVVNTSAIIGLFTVAEQDLIKGIYANEKAHKKFYEDALGGNKIQALEVDFSSIDFTTKASVLKAAYTFEDTGVGAYNGAGQLLADVKNLAVAGKIVSVEGRHAATLRDLASGAILNSPLFAGDDIVDVNGLDSALTVDQVMQKIAPYVKTKLNANDLPKS